MQESNVIFKPTHPRLVMRKAFDKKVESLIRQCEALALTESTHKLTFCFDWATFNELSARAIIDGWYRQLNSRLYRKSVENWRHRAIPLLYIEDKQTAGALTYRAWAEVPAKHVERFAGMASTVFDPVESYGASVAVDAVSPGLAQIKAVAEMFELWESSPACRPNPEPPMLH